MVGDSFKGWNICREDPKRLFILDNQRLRVKLQTQRVQAVLLNAMLSQCLLLPPPCHFVSQRKSIDTWHSCRLLLKQINYRKWGTNSLLRHRSTRLDAGLHEPYVYLCVCVFFCCSTGVLIWYYILYAREYDNRVMLSAHVPVTLHVYAYAWGAKLRGACS